MKYTIIAPFGEEIESLLNIIKEVAIEKIILLAQETDLTNIFTFESELRKLKIEIDTRKLQSFTLQNIFVKIKELKEENKQKEILICASTADKYTAAIISSAAFINDLKVFHVINNEVVFMPLLRFSYCEELGKRKIDILKTLYEQNCCSSLEELSKTLKISLPLAAYHINGTKKSKGLKELGLVQATDYKNRIDIKITPLGIMVLKGYTGTNPIKIADSMSQINTCAN